MLRAATLFRTLAATSVAWAAMTVAYLVVLRGNHEHPCGKREKTPGAYTAYFDRVAAANHQGDVDGDGMLYATGYTGMPPRAWAHAVVR